MEVGLWAGDGGVGEVSSCVCAAVDGEGVVGVRWWREVGEGDLGVPLPSVFVDGGLKGEWQECVLWLSDAVEL